MWNVKVLKELLGPLPWPSLEKQSARVCSGCIIHISSHMQNTLIPFPQSLPEFLLSLALGLGLRFRTSVRPGPGAGAIPWVQIPGESSLNIIPLDLKTWGLKEQTIYPPPHLYPMYNGEVYNNLPIPKGKNRRHIEVTGP